MGAFGKDPNSPKNVLDPYSLYKRFSAEMKSLDKNLGNHLAIVHILLEMN